MTEKQFEEIKKIGHWELTITDEVDVMAYFLYCKDIYRRKHMTLTYVNPPVFDQNYFQTTGIVKKYKQMAVKILREEKLNGFISKIKNK